LDIDLMMTKQAAIDLRDWLATRVADLEKMEADYAARQKGGG
jgi:hypothetical protein